MHIAAYHASVDRLAVVGDRNRLALVVSNPALFSESTFVLFFGARMNAWLLKTTI